jgi:hypothetical protein
MGSNVSRQFGNGHCAWVETASRDWMRDEGRAGHAATRAGGADPAGREALLAHRDTRRGTRYILRPAVAQVEVSECLGERANAKVLVAAHVVLGARVPGAASRGLHNQRIGR